MPTSAGAVTQFLSLQLRNRNATWLARATAHRNVVLEVACRSSLTAAGSRLSLPRRSLVITTCSAATLTPRRSVAFPALFRLPLTEVAPTLPSQTACLLARLEASPIAVLSTTRSATAATLLLRPLWRAQSLWLPAATTLARATAVRAVVVHPASSCTPPTCLEQDGGEHRQGPGKTEQRLAMKYFASDHSF